MTVTHTGMMFAWEWCELCETAFIRCPKCGNNCCNGGYGTVDGKECDVCPLAYQYQEAVQHLEPTKPFGGTVFPTVHPVLTTADSGGS